jgi:hypothetical protein
MRGIYFLRILNSINWGFMIKNLKLGFGGFVCALAFSSSTTNAETVIGTVQVRGHYVWRCTGQCVEQFMTDYQAGIDELDSMEGMELVWEWDSEPPLEELKNIPNSPKNNVRANCQTPEYHRFEHAVKDYLIFVSTRLLSRPTAGTVVTIEYDDGATEKWITTGTIDDTALLPLPVSGSLSCN